MKQIIALFVKINGQIRRAETGTFVGVMRNSRVNGADNHQEHLPVNGWDWPKATFLQTRLEQKRGEPR